MSVDFLKDLTNKVVIVTGSSSGIGEAIAVLFSQLGSKVVISGRNQERILKVAKKCETISPFKFKPLTVVGDLSLDENVKQLVENTVEKHGSIDVLVNAAAVVKPVKIADENLMETYEEVMNLNVRAFLLLCHLCLPHLVKTKGRIVSISSIASMKPWNDMVLHGMSKAAIDMLVKTMALEYGAKGVRVNSVNPGAVDTPVWDSLAKLNNFSSSKAIAAKNCVLNKIGEPEEIARTVAFLASDASSFITGTNVVVDGGALIKQF